MFCVYKARMNSKYVTLKTPRHPDAMLHDMLLREYELSNTLSHPAIVTTLAFSDATPCGTAIIREYVEGVTLADYLEREPTIKERDAIVHDMLDAVAYLHRRGISHNDLKPENIIIGRGSSVHIIDFGLSLSDDSAYRGCVGGTPEFTAPEVLRDGTVEGNSSDIYSLGALVAYIYDNKRYNSIVRCAMNIAPEQRYSSVDELRTAMRRDNTKRQLLRVVPITALVAIAILLLLVVGGRDDDGGVKDEQLMPIAEIEQLETLFDSMDSIVRGEQHIEFVIARIAYYRIEAQRIMDGARVYDAPYRDSVERYFARRLRALEDGYSRLPSITTLPEDEYTRALQEIEDITNGYIDLL